MSQHSIRSRSATALLALIITSAAEAAPPPKKPPTTAAILEESKPTEWRALDPENTIYLELAGGRVVMELAPAFAPKHVANIKTLAREGYYDGLAFMRSQDNYVVQWGDPAGDAKEKQRPMKNGQAALKSEFDRAWSKDLSFTPLGNVDGYSPEGGFSSGFPAGRDLAKGRIWLAHCYAMLGAGRGDTADSGSGAELYVVIGNAPRHLDRNVTLVGRVVQGMELLSVLPRGTGALGFYEKPEQYVPIKSIKVAADVAESARVKLEVMRTESDSFKRLIAARRNRSEDWFLAKADYVELCNVPIPVRAAVPTAD